ncbi:hypothetical protein [Novosphingobium sp. PP1Y]|uniref:hypothetical protein n=1 Tax=Novosphingobium sp. PP1Y TaxID=702113 RepID=UPI00020EE8DE|nr:hypothetical protein [Novosphingobium sp. PP1Y]CCA91593.1 hypothetical protein PP1Y_AT6323 [Novosphingobium sp. PP1Y]
MIAYIACRSLGVSVLAGLSLAAGGRGTGNEEKPLVPPSEEVTTVAEPMAIASEAAMQTPGAPLAPLPVAVTEPRIPAKPPVRDFARVPGGLEGKCLASVGEVTHAPVLGTRSIDGSGPTIKIYVNVQGAHAPWLCRGNRDGTIAGVMYTGSEGEL